MKLKEVFISLVGFFKCTIENNIVICAGIEKIIHNDDDEIVAEVFVFDVYDPISRSIPNSIMVVFNQVKDKLLFLYRKDKYEVISITDDLIKLTKDGVDYSISRLRTLEGV